MNLYNCLINHCGTTKERDEFCLLQMKVLWRGGSANELQNNSKGPCEETGAKVSTATLKWVRCHHGLRGCSARSSSLQGNAGQRQKPSAFLFLQKKNWTWCIRSWQWRGDWSPPAQPWSSIMSSGCSAATGTGPFPKADGTKMEFTE